MNYKLINELSITEPRESTISIEDIRTRLSSIKDEKGYNGNSYFNGETIFNAEVFLCLANKIHELEQEINKLKHEL